MQALNSRNDGCSFLPSKLTSLPGQLRHVSPSNPIHPLQQLTIHTSPPPVHRYQQPITRPPSLHSIHTYHSSSTTSSQMDLVEPPTPNQPYPPTTETTRRTAYARFPPHSPTTRTVRDATNETYDTKRVFLRNGFETVDGSVYNQHIPKEARCPICHAGLVWIEKNGTYFPLPTFYFVWFHVRY